MVRVLLYVMIGITTLSETLGYTNFGVLDRHKNKFLVFLSKKFILNVFLLWFWKNYKKTYKMDCMLFSSVIKSIFWHKSYIISSINNKKPILWFNIALVFRTWAYPQKVALGMKYWYLIKCVTLNLKIIKFVINFEKLFLGTYRSHS